MKFLAPILASLMLVSCSGNAVPKINHDYPTPPSVKRLSEPGACQGGEKLAAKSLPLPEFPRRAKRQGRMGWVIVKLDVLSDGHTANLSVRDSAPAGIFDKSALKAVKSWQFAPPGNEGLQGCLVFLDYRFGKVRIGK